MNFLFSDYANQGVGGDKMVIAFLVIGGIMTGLLMSSVIVIMCMGTNKWRIK